MSVSFECCVLSGRSLCVGLITRPEVKVMGKGKVNLIVEQAVKTQNGSRGIALLFL
jgi:hypothetical protein